MVGTAQERLCPPYGLAMTESSESPPHPDLRLLVFCVRLPWAACSRMLCFSSSRWPLVVSRGTSGALPAPLWLLLSSGTGGTCFDLFVIQTTSVMTRRTIAGRASFPAQLKRRCPY